MTVTIDVGSAFKAVVVVLFLGVGVVLVALVVAKIKGFFASRSFDADDRAAMAKRWREIEAMLEAPGEMNRKVALLEADKLLDAALRSLAMPGTTLGERLRFAQYKYPELRDVWWAHRVRNQLAHEASYHLDDGLARKAVKEFRRALERIGAI